MAVRARRMPVDGQERRGWWVTIADGVILEVGPQPPAGADQWDLGEVDLLPGLVDLHSDCLIQRVLPRPTMELPVAAALLDLDAEVVAHGITTHFLCLSLDEGGSGFRTEERCTEVLGALAEIEGDLRADHRIHLRIDVAVPDLGAAQRLAKAGPVGLVSYMDHTPGQGQYSDESSWREFYEAEARMSGLDLDGVLARKRAGQPGADDARLTVAAIARDVGAVLASHDDDSPDAVRRASALGARIAEFPVTLAASSAAMTAGLGTVMGAPNARRGGSHVANLSTREALAAGCLTALASDYHPPSLLAAAYLLADCGACTWVEAVDLVAGGPARLAGLDDRGAIEPGRRADLVAVSSSGGRPRVVQTWVGGRPVLGLPVGVGAR
jgi:alpha-D-ribose 1-methylphosphonate 5-triphosphate diphosphatase